MSCSTEGEAGGEEEAAVAAGDGEPSAGLRGSIMGRSGGSPRSRRETPPQSSPLVSSLGSLLPMVATWVQPARAASYSLASFISPGRQKKKTKKISDKMFLVC